MDTSCKTVERLHDPRQSRYTYFAAAETITAQDIKHSSVIELYAIASEHWCKCSPCAKSALLNSNNHAIRTQADMLSKCLDVSAKTVAA